LSPSCIVRTAGIIGLMAHLSPIESEARTSRRIFGVSADSLNFSTK
jgi:hypothetical protein